MTKLELSHHVKNAGRWLLGLLSLIALYLFATRAGRQEKKAQRAGDKYWESSTDTINSRWRDADKHQKNHEKAQRKAKNAKETARKIRDAAASNNTSLDDLLDEYRSNRVLKPEDSG